MWIDRLIVGIMLTLVVVNTGGIAYILKKMNDYDSEVWGLGDDDDDDDDEEDNIFPPYSPKNRVRSN